MVPETFAGIGVGVALGDGDGAGVGLGDGDSVGVGVGDELLSQFLPRGLRESSGRRKPETSPLGFRIDLA